MEHALGSLKFKFRFVVSETQCVLPLREVSPLSVQDTLLKENQTIPESKKEQSETINII